MAQRAKHFTYCPPQKPGGPVSALPSSWGKGLLLGLVLVFVALLLDVVTPDRCAPGDPGAANYVSLNVAGFSMSIRWSYAGCR